ncbi:glycosyltransferase family 4 protein [Azospirillum sp. sgz302134]
MRIAVFDYKVRPTNAIGGLHRTMMAALADEHEFVVFAPEFDNPRPDRIEHVPVPTPLRPLALQYLVYHLTAPLAAWRYRRKGGQPFDRVLCVESNILRSDVVHAQFCHRAFVQARRSWGKPGLATLARRIDHHLRALTEPFVYRTARRVVVPSEGLRREMEEQFPWLAPLMTVIPSPIDHARMRPPADFDRDRMRAGLDLAPDDLAMVFTALGHFERKGLPLILEAMASRPIPNMKLVVVGGRPDAVAAARKQAEALGLGERVVFTGMQPDVRPFLWAADAFVFPSQYETFSLSCYEAAAAGLPIIVSRLYGVEEFARNGDTALVVERTPAALARAMDRLACMTPAERRAMGERAAAAVADRKPERFVQDWRAFWRAAATDAEGTGTGRVPAAREALP